MRIENNGVRYFGLAELAQTFGITNTKNNNKANKQEKFCKRHLCKTCKQPMTFIGGNIMCCKNESCPGIRKQIDEEVVKYFPSYDLLDDVGEAIATHLFD